MANKQTTAVEWLKNKLPSLFIDDSGHYRKLFDKALQMEREQIKNAWISAWKDSMIEPLEDKFYEPDAEQYYNETFSKQ